MMIYKCCYLCCTLETPFVFFKIVPLLLFSLSKLLDLTSEFNEVYFSEMGEAEATHSRDPQKINLGGETCKVSEPLNSCSILLNTWRDWFLVQRCRRQKIKVISGAYSIKRTQWAIKNKYQGAIFSSSFHRGEFRRVFASFYKKKIRVHLLKIFANILSNSLFASPLNSLWGIPKSSKTLLNRL